jgi:hypothetical protein
MRQMMTTAGEYTLVILKSGPRRDEPGKEPIIWERARRNVAMRAEGPLSIVCLVCDDGDVHGIGIFSTSPDETRALMDADPGVQASIFANELHPTRGFPGDFLPADPSPNPSPNPSHFLWKEST